ncbi:hypothetical protein B0H16DRAFT_1474503 [Mycena metata]|uniref:Uncharacterized protein n=1 Tax=Mycena metata TaxID=1033252 RepID=A0AAD7HGT9_9AGAR|nr:hypothetical protein B0H16DRAFT_1474503 [Mycena metata]
MKLQRTYTRPEMVSSVKENHDVWACVIRPRTRGHEIGKLSTPCSLEKGDKMRDGLKAELVAGKYCGAPVIFKPHYCNAKIDAVHRRVEGLGFKRLRSRRRAKEMWCTVDPMPTTASTKQATRINEDVSEEGGQGARQKTGEKGVKKSCGTRGSDLGARWVQKAYGSAYGAAAQVKRMSVLCWIYTAQKCHRNEEGPAQQSKRSLQEIKVPKHADRDSPHASRWEALKQGAVLMNWRDRRHRGGGRREGAGLPSADPPTTHFAHLTRSCEGAGPGPDEKKSTLVSFTDARVKGMKEKQKTRMHRRITSPSSLVCCRSSEREAVREKTGHQPERSPQAAVISASEARIFGDSCKTQGQDHSQTDRGWIRIESADSKTLWWEEARRVCSDQTARLPSFLPPPPSPDLVSKPGGYTALRDSKSIGDHSSTLGYPLPLCHAPTATFHNQSLTGLRFHTLFGSSSCTIGDGSRHEGYWFVSHLDMSLSRSKIPSFSDYSAQCGLDPTMVVFLSKLANIHLNKSFRIPPWSRAPLLSGDILCVQYHRREIAIAFTFCPKPTFARSLNLILLFGRSTFCILFCARGHPLVFPCGFRAASPDRRVWLASMILSIARSWVKADRERVYSSGARSLREYHTVSFSTAFSPRNICRHAGSAQEEVFPPNSVSDLRPSLRLTPTSPRADSALNNARTACPPASRYVALPRRTQLLWRNNERSIARVVIRWIASGREWHRVSIGIPAVCGRAPQGAVDVAFEITSCVRYGAGNSSVANRRWNEGDWKHLELWFSGSTLVPSVSNP